MQRPDVHPAIDLVERPQAPLPGLRLAFEGRGVKPAGRMLLREVKGDGERFPQHEAAVVDCRQATVGIDGQKFRRLRACRTDLDRDVFVVDAEFHRKTSIRCSAYSGIYNDGDISDLLTHDAQIRGVLNSHTGTDRSCKRHYCGCTCIDELSSHNQIVSEVGQHCEPFLDENLSRFKSRLVIREECFLISNHLDLDPLGHPDFSSQPSCSDSLLGCEASGRVGQQRIPLEVDEI